jgi:hypothetical protein
VQGTAEADPLEISTISFYMFDEKGSFLSGEWEAWDDDTISWNVWLESETKTFVSIDFVTSVIKYLKKIFPILETPEARGFNVRS